MHTKISNTVFVDEFKQKMYDAIINLDSLIPGMGDYVKVVFNTMFEKLVCYSILF
jgi:hypothetical protein